MLRVSATSPDLIPRAIAHLRGHTAAITTAAFVYLPTFQATLVTGDSDGYVIWWDLTTRRALNRWRAHTATIVTIQQLGIQWDGPHAATDSAFGVLLTHGKDNEMRFWSLFSSAPDGSIEWGDGQSGDLALIAAGTASLKPPPPHTGLPVNALNFCNVHHHLHLLATPGTLSAEQIDIYYLPFTSGGGSPTVRLAAGIDPQELAIAAGLVAINPTPGLDTQRGGFGSIMCVHWVNSRRLVIGTESGHTITLAVPDPLLVHESAAFTAELSCIAVSSNMSPDSITTIESLGLTVVVGGTDTSVEIFDIDDPSASFKFTTDHSGTASLSLDGHNHLSAATWDGNCTVYHLPTTGTSNVPLMEVATMRKAPQVDADPLAWATGVQDATSKPNSLGRAKTVCYSREPETPEAHMHKPTRRRRPRVDKAQVMVVGYDDSSVGLFVNPSGL